MIIINILIWPVFKLTETFRIHQILCFLVGMTLLRHVVGQWKTASATCLSDHNNLSSEITFNANCPKDKGVADADDPSDKKKHQCLMMRRHCAKKCKGTDNTCPATSLFILNLKVNKQTKAFESVECICSYSSYISSCTGEYTDTWSDVENEFNENCAADETKADCVKLAPVGLGKIHLSTPNSNDRVNHNNSMKLSCYPDQYVCPATLPADCIIGEALVTCNDGIWEPFEPAQCVEDLERVCPQIRGKLLNGKCLSLILRDSAERKCEQKDLGGGILMTKKSQALLTEIADQFNLRNDIDGDTTKKYQLLVILNNNLTTGQTLAFQGQVAADATRIVLNLDGNSLTNRNPRQSKTEVKHRALNMDIAFDLGYIAFQANGEDEFGIRDPTKVSHNAMSAIPTSLKPGQPLDLTITKTETHFEIKIGSVVKTNTYDESLYVNSVSIAGQGLKIDSAKLDGKEMRFGDEDKYYTDCLLVGLTDKDRNPKMGPKNGWVWDDGKTAKPDETLWDTDQPNYIDGYVCLNIITKKLRSVSNLLKRYAICEYSFQTKIDETEKRKKREVEDMNGIRRETKKQMNYEL